MSAHTAAEALALLDSANMEMKQMLPSLEGQAAPQGSQGGASKAAATAAAATAALGTGSLLQTSANSIAAVANTDCCLVWFLTCCCSRGSSQQCSLRGGGSGHAAVPLQLCCCSAHQQTAAARTGKQGICVNWLSTAAVALHGQQRCTQHGRQFQGSVPEVCGSPQQTGSFVFGLAAGTRSVIQVD
jgi:hypothetical protein